MKTLLLSLVTVCAFAHVAHANESELYENEAAAYSEEMDMSAYTDGMTLDEDITAFGRGGRHDGPGRGNPGRGRDDGHWGPHPAPRPGPGPRPGPRPGPGPRPHPRPPGHGGPGHGGPGYPPPHRPTIEYVTCESHGNRYNTCYINPYGIRNFYLARQRSDSACIAGRSFGFARNYVWVDRGCRGVFAIERY
ncbi:DUF3011 domain-containing protein [Bdellovibrio sp. HCB288]|uniref:DUF3011 domain-containing protein n=1 Tax=Bdellovibrio sp. HCB288 TaxID=3394355 RepID=UPI0039B690A0